MVICRCNAKYLWKRIPASVKSANAEIGQIWAVGQQMWQRDFPAAYKALVAVTWSEHVADIMKSVQGTIIHKTHTHGILHSEKINVQNVCFYIGVCLQKMYVAELWIL